MRYGITLCTTDNRSSIDISAAEFAAIKRAKSNLLTVLSIEEKFDAVLENYGDYERELLNLAFDHMMHQGSWDWATGIRDIFRINRRLVNILTMTRLYTDQVKHDLAKLFISVPCAVSQCFSNEYDTVFAYRFMEALRNHVQHRALPIGQIEYPSGWEGRKDERMAVMRWGVVPRLDLHQLQENPRFKAAVLEEVTQLTTHPDVTLFIRQYIESFNRIHQTVRTVLSQPESEWVTAYTHAFESSRAALGDRKHVDVVSEDDAGNRCERVALVRDLLERITQLRQYNTILHSMSRWYLSNEVR